MPWLEHSYQTSYDGHEYDAMFCSLCRKWNTIARNGKSVWNKEGCVPIRLDVIIAHEQSEMHKQALFRELSAVNGIDKAYDEFSKKEVDALKDAQTVLFFLIKHNLPHHTLFEPLVNLCISLGASNLPFLFKGKNATYTSSASVNEFLQCQNEVVSTEIEKEISDSGPFGFMIDEYTDVSCNKHLAFVSKYLLDGSSKIAFLQDIQLYNGTAEHIYSKMKSYLETSSVKLNKMTSFACDGPSVMLGKKNGVVAKLKEDNPHIINIHCMNHCLQLAVSKAFNSIPAIKNTDELLEGLFKYYHYSTVKSERLKAVQNILRETGEIDLKANLTVVRGIHTRWLSHEAAV